MAEEKPSPLELARNFLNRFTLSQKIFMGAVIVLTVVAIVFIVNLSSALTYGVLFSNLSAKDSGQILEQLKAKKVPYKIEGGGTVIKVPEEMVSELRIEMASNGLPEGGGVGFEIFDKNSLSATDFVQNINYLRAIEGELTRTLSEIKEVRSAKVHITMPKRSVFIDEQEEAKASIVLNLRPGAALSESLVPAILHLTAQAVEGLKPENIAIIDVQGKLLSKPKGSGDDIFAEMSSTQLSYQKKMEDNMTRDIVSVLEPTIGSGKVRANVKLKLNFDKVESTEETYDPNATAKVSESSETSSSTGASRSGGVPGVSSNVGQAGTTTTTTPDPSLSGGKSKSEKSLINYEVSKKVTHLTKPVGEIERLSVAVVVDDATTLQTRDGELTPETRKRTPDEIETIKKIVQAAVGFNQERGDVIEVANLPFDNTAMKVDEVNIKKERNKELLTQLGTYAAIVIGVLLLIFAVIRPVTRRVLEILKQARAPKTEEIEIPRVDSEKLAALQEAKDEAEIEKELMEKYKVPKSTRKMGFIREKVKKFAQENLDETASLVKSFLVEE
ncbi:MAG: flagellar basal-body MS-ring/collar protein FliF [Candidatus Omnitrophota bacterium]